MSIAPLKRYRRWLSALTAPQPIPAADGSNHVMTEVDHWNAIERQTRAGERIFWTQHPRISQHYNRKARIDGMCWQDWVPHALGGPAKRALELGCGSSYVLGSMMRAPTALSFVAMDLDDTRFASAREALGSHASKVAFVAGDANQLDLEPESFDLICAVQSFHHFEKLEHIYAQIHQALRPGGLCVLDEYVGPPRFQWTDAQMALTRQMLGLMPLSLRTYANGMEKREEGRSLPEDVIRVCPSEAIRSDEIVPLFYETFDVLHHKKLGGTIQHLLYSGIVHNLPDDDPAAIHLIDCVDGLEQAFIDHQVLQPDFVLLIGRKR